MTAPLLIRNVLADDDAGLLSEMLGVIRKQTRRNLNLSELYDGKKQVRSLGIAVSPEFDTLETVVGWPGTVVDILNERRTLDSVSVGDSADLTDALQSAWDANEMGVETRMAHDDKAIHGLSFVVVARSGDRTLILPTPASRMTMLYDRSIKAGYAAASNDPPQRRGDKPQHTLYLPDRTIVVERDGGKFKIIEQFTNPSGVLPVVRFVNRPRHEKPWGRSEINPAVISHTEAAVRTLMAMEVAREFFAAPMRYALNIDPEAFQDEQGNTIPAWQTYWGRFIALAAAETDDGMPGPAPSLNQLPASSPAPLTEMIKMYSQLISAEKGIPPSNLGFVTENPPSGDGQRMYEGRLVRSAKAANQCDTPGWQNVARLVLLAEVGQVGLAARVRVHWENPNTATPAADTDAVVKQVQVGIVPAASAVALETLGYDAETVQRVESDRRMQRAANVVAGLAERATAARTDPRTAAIESARVPDGAVA